MRLMDVLIPRKQLLSLLGLSEPTLRRYQALLAKHLRKSFSSKAAFQLKQVTRHLTVRPLAAYDWEYGNAKFVLQTADIEVDLLLRLASNRCLWGAPPLYRGLGRPPKPGHKFKLNAPYPWPETSGTLGVEDPELGQVKVSHWSTCHFRQAAQREMEVLRVEVLKPVGRKRKFKPLWLVWLGQTMPSLDELWWKYLRRFAKETLLVGPKVNPEAHELDIRREKNESRRRRRPRKPLSLQVHL